jgi:signal peptidase II
MQNTKREVFLKRYLKNYAVLFLSASFLIIIDQWTKALVRANLAEGQMWAPWDWLLPYARIIHWYNTGVAFGMFQNKGYLFAIPAIIVALLIIYFFPRISPKEWMMRLALCLQLAGALGNLIDRFTMQGRVTDFISIGNFPVWNVADSCITVGVAVLMLAVWLQERRDKIQKETQQKAVEQVDQPKIDPTPPSIENPSKIES